MMGFRDTQRIHNEEQWREGTKRALIFDVIYSRRAMTPDEDQVKQWLRDAAYTLKFWAEVYEEALALAEKHDTMAAIDLALEVQDR